MDQDTDQPADRHPAGQDVGLRESLRLARRELKWTQLEHEHQAESLQRVRRQRARLREQLDASTEALAEALSRLYWAEARDAGAGLRRLVRRGSSGPDATEADLVAEVEASDLFDGAWYLRRHPDAVRDRVAPAVHLVRHGNERGLDPSERFDTSAYLAEHPDAVASGLPALVHHLRSGA